MIDQQTPPVGPNAGREDDMDTRKLDYGEKHILSLIARDRDQNGWAQVSSVLYPHLCKTLPTELVMLEPVGDAGRVKLTQEGEAVVSAMKFGWL